MTPVIRIDHVSVTNFRSFGTLHLDLHPELTVLVARNGVGKTAVLDALGVALRYFVDKIVGSGRSRGFDRGDIRRVRGPSGAMVEQLPTSVEVVAAFHGVRHSWKRVLATAQGKTSDLHAKVLQEQATQLCTHLQTYATGRRTDAPELPIIASYGAGRQWSTRRSAKTRSNGPRGFDQPLSAYTDCLASSSHYTEFSAWFEAAEREAQKERAGGPPSPHRPQDLLAAVRSATEPVLLASGWSDLGYDFLTEEIVTRHPTRGQLPVSSLSDGVRNLLAMVADIAHRCVRLNPHHGATAPENTSGICSAPAGP